MIYIDNNKVNKGKIVTTASGSNDYDWSKIGYDIAPLSIQKDFDYAKQLKENWKPGDIFTQDNNLGILPLIGSKDEDYSLALFCHLDNNLYDVSSLKNYDFSRVTSLYSAFKDCKNILNKKIEISLNAPKCYDMNGMFLAHKDNFVDEIIINDFNSGEDCSLEGFVAGRNIKKLTITGDLSKISNLNVAFAQCESLEYFYVSGDLGANMKLTKIDVSETKIGASTSDNYNLIAMGTLSTSLANRHQIAEEQGIPFVPCQIIVSDEAYNGYFDNVSMKTVQERFGYEMIPASAVK